MPAEPVPLRIVAAEYHLLPMRTRFPFKFGIASMSALPHVFLTLRLEIAGRMRTGVSSEGFPPKWFTKDPETPFEEDLRDFEAVVRHAVDTAIDLTRRRERTFFALWEELEGAQAAWARAHGHPPLLANLGVSLVERAALLGLCRALSLPLHALARDNLLDVDLGRVRAGLRGVVPAAVVPPRPREWVAARHTVGLGDALTDADLDSGERVVDGLPQTLEENIAAYGLRYFKVKLLGDLEVDAARLESLEAIFRRCCPGGYVFTLDGNENFASMEEFIDHWRRHLDRPPVRRLADRLLFIEQPVHRSAALSEGAGKRLAEWRDRPPVIIDESDGEMGDFPRALVLGYDGVSYKNCKGFVKGLANAALVARGRSEGRRAILSSEDLANVGPVALMQDLAAIATLGIEHSERNGHHYFRGLSACPRRLQEAVVAAHGDLYRWRPEGFAAVSIERGRISTSTVARAPFGLGFDFDPSAWFRALGPRAWHLSPEAT